MRRFDVEEIAAAQLVALGHRRLEVRGVGRDDRQVGREHQVRAGQRFEQAFEDLAAAPQIGVGLAPHRVGPVERDGVRVHERSEHDDRCDHQEGGARGGVVVPRPLTHQPQRPQHDGDAEDRGHQPPHHRTPRRVPRHQTHEPDVGADAKDSEAQHEQDRGGMQRHADVTRKPVERACAVGVADEREQRDEDHGERQVLGGAAPPARRDAEQGQRRADEGQRDGRIRRHPIAPSAGHDLELVREQQGIHAPIPAR